MSDSDKSEILTAQEITEIAALISRGTIAAKEAYRYVELNEKLAKMHRQALVRESKPPPEGTEDA